MGVTTIRRGIICNIKFLLHFYHGIMVSWYHGNTLNSISENTACKILPREIRSARPPGRARQPAKFERRDFVFRISHPNHT